MAAPSGVSAATSAFGTAAASFACNMPSTVNAGDLLVLGWCYSPPGTNGTGAIPSGWVSVSGSAGSVAVPNQVIARYADGTEAGTTVTVNTDGSTGKACAVCVRITGHAYTSNTDITADGPGQGTDVSGTSVNPDGPVSKTTPSRDNLFLTVAFWVNTGTVSAVPTGYSNIAGSTLFAASGGSGAAGTKCAMSFAQKQALASTSDNPSAWTITTSAAWRTNTYVFGPSAPPLPTPNVNFVRNAVPEHPSLNIHTGSYW